MNFYSPLRYPGGKGKISNYFKEIITKNNLYDGIYVEPYTGGGAIALSLLFNEYISKVVLNDIDRSIYSFWYSVLNNTEELCRRIHDYPITIENWLYQKGIQERKKSVSLIDLGFSTFFLNRTNRSGIINAGVIGGIEQKGKWKINARFNKPDLIKRIQRIAYYNDRIELLNMDALTLIKEKRKSLPKNTLFYLDPPYFVKGKELYLNFYTLKDHINISKEISLIENQKWIITYDSVKEIKSLYNSFRMIDFDLNYSAAKASKGKEVIIYSNNLKIAETEQIFSKNR